MGAIVYLKEVTIRDVRQTHGMRGAEVAITVTCLSDNGKELGEFIDWSRNKLITIIRNYSMDWHVPQKPERIEFILDIMGQIMELQSANKLEEAKALFELVERVLPTYTNYPNYQTAEDLRNVIWDNIMLRKKK